ncbi:MAG: lytic murein transglycosylase [Alphaproteobacteria bacterium]
MAIIVLGVLAGTPAMAASSTEWVRGFWPSAKAAGVTRATYNAALGNFEPDRAILDSSRSQPEFNTEIWHYMDRMVSEERLIEGQRVLQEHAALFTALEQRYGVDRHIIASIWGMESHYGAVLTNPRLVKSTVRSLATLAYSGGRLAKFGRRQLIAALKIIQRGDVTVAGMTGSWAGAMGHTQFIPTTFEAYGADFDGDGRRNIWTSIPDALASAANYLDKVGWRQGQTWGYEVDVPRSYAGGKGERSLASWSKRGIRRVGGKPFPRPGDKAYLYRPAGRAGPSFLLIRNFRVIKRYNNANSYALAVGHLADRLAGGGAFVKDWPPHEKPLTLSERKRLQVLLAELGYYDGEIDGDIGSGSRAAIQQYQRLAGLKVDGVDDRDLLQRIEKVR